MHGDGNSPSKPPKVLLLALSDDYWTPFVVDFGRLLRENGFECVVATDCRAGEYQSFGRRIGDQLGMVYYFSDFLDRSRRSREVSSTGSIGMHAMFSDYFRLRVQGAKRRAERVDWRGLADSMERFFRTIFEKEGIDLIIHDQVSTSFSYVCHEVASSKGIPYLGLVGACAPDRYETRESIYDEHLVVDRYYREILDGISPLTDEEDRWASAYLDTIDQQEPSYMKGKDNILNDARLLRHINGAKLRSFLRKCWYQVRERAEVTSTTFREPPVMASLRNFSLNVRRVHHKRRFTAFTRPIDNRWMEANRFVIYPIQFQPEAATSVGSPYFVNQTDVIRNIAFSLPGNLQLVVKEHRSAVGFNTASFYREVATLPGVRLVSDKLNIKHLIRRSEGVVALTSTAAFEALLLGKPVWLFGSTPFQAHPLCHTVRSFQEFAEALRKKPMRLPTHDPKAFLVAYRRYTRPGVISYQQPCWGIGTDLLAKVRERLCMGPVARQD